ncbi:MAG TPA: hypothetical protein VG758_02700 [Hyphomicrobiaceae bacterium]|jgi:hypothetical protein|nr:hypothetical protein [Hyphomicrobiaceae bacterium]
MRDFYEILDDFLKLVREAGISFEKNFGDLTDAELEQATNILVRLIIEGGYSLKPENVDVLKRSVMENATNMRAEVRKRTAGT